jgi:peptidoglycan/xylan/chitin deacetylase (PgdA/CDA1 family)
MYRALKQLAKQTAYGWLSTDTVLGYWRARTLRECAVVLMYHELAADDEDIESWLIVKRNDFCRQVEYLKRHFDVVSLDDAIRRMSGGEERERPLAVLTFDDGYLGNLEVLAPVLAEFECPATVFVATGAVQDQSLYWYDRLISRFQGQEALLLDLTDRSLSRYRINHRRGPENWNEIERLLTDLKRLDPDQRRENVEAILDRVPVGSDGHEGGIRYLTVDDVRALSDSKWVTIGAHSHCHNLLSQLSVDDARRSIETSKQLLELWTGRPVTLFSYPNGDYSGAVIDAVRAAGFRAAVTTRPRPWTAGDSVFEIPRIGVGRYDSLAAFKVRGVGVRV